MGRACIALARPVSRRRWRRGRLTGYGPDRSNPTDWQRQATCWELAGLTETQLPNRKPGYDLTALDAGWLIRVAYRTLQSLAHLYSPTASTLVDKLADIHLPTARLEYLNHIHFSLRITD